MGLNLTCGMLKRCLINIEDDMIYHFSAQVINGDPREMIDFKYYTFIYNFISNEITF